MRDSMAQGKPIKNGPIWKNAARKSRTGLRMPLSVFIKTATMKKPFVVLRYFIMQNPKKGRNWRKSFRLVLTGCWEIKTPERLREMRTIICCYIHPAPW
jgi:hypothetical protein